MECHKEVCGTQFPNNCLLENEYISYHKNALQTALEEII
jgi:hypothetical protein